MPTNSPLSLDGLIQHVERNTPSNDPLDLLATASETAQAVSDLSDSLLSHFVDRCRRAGHSWTEIGGSLGVTKQAAQKRFVPRFEPTFERYTDRARRVLPLATEAARSFGHNYRGTEHLLLALFDESGGVAAKALEELGARRDEVVEMVSQRIGRGGGDTGGELPMTPRAVQALQEALNAALQLGHNYIGTEHILLGVAAVEGGLAAQILGELGVTRPALQKKIVQLLANYKASSGG